MVTSDGSFRATHSLGWTSECILYDGFRFDPLTDRIDGVTVGKISACTEERAAITPGDNKCGPFTPAIDLHDPGFPGPLPPARAVVNLGRNYTCNETTLFTKQNTELAGHTDRQAKPTSAIQV